MVDSRGTHGANLESSTENRADTFALRPFFFQISKTRPHAHGHTEGNTKQWHDNPYVGFQPHEGRGHTNTDLE
jgi:hypothetical protein